MGDKAKEQSCKKKQKGPKCICGTGPYKGRRIAFSSMWDDGGRQDHSDDDIYGLIYRLEQRIYEPLAPDMADKVVRKSLREMEKARESSRVMRDSYSQPVAPFELSEIKFGRYLGSGGFSSVYEVAFIEPKKSDNNKYTPDEQAARQFVTDHAKRKSTGESRYAIKHLRSRLMERPKKFANGAIDLTMEAQFLQKLDHPNILRIRGIAAAGPRGFANGRHDGFFLIIDKMKETLEDRIMLWRKRLKRLKNPLLKRIVDKNGRRREQLLIERLLVAFKIASAVEYLHSKGIIYRDLKPNNVGFDIRGDTKIFDFGLCRELPEEQEADGPDGTYQMSGKVGTLRYMAPEVKRRQRYNQKADVYSYALVLYEMLSLSRPWGSTKSKNKDDETPETPSAEPRSEDRELRICPCWPPAIKRLLKRAWSETISERPTMEEVCDVLREVIVELQNGDDSGLRPEARRRSTYIMDMDHFKHLSLGDAAAGAAAASHARGGSYNTLATSTTESAIGGSCTFKP